MYSIEIIKQILMDMGVSPHRLRGQNFLIDEAMIERIINAADISTAEFLLEIGPGLGALSQHLAQSGKPTVLLEVEAAFAERLRNLFYFDQQVNVIEADAVKFDYIQFCRDKGLCSYDVVANLPYNITTPILERLLLYGGSWRQATMMLQKEAALRICSGSGRDNGPVTLLTQYCAEAELLFEVSPKSFYPEPAVYSAVIQLRRRKEPPVDVELPPLLGLIKAAFSQRRKQLVNTLSSAYQRDDGYRFSREQIAAALERCEFSGNIRAEQLGLPEFAALWKALQNV